MFEKVIVDCSPDPLFRELQSLFYILADEIEEADGIFLQDDDEYLDSIRGIDFDKISDEKFELFCEGIPKMLWFRNVDILNDADRRGLAPELEIAPKDAVIFSPDPTILSEHLITRHPGLELQNAVLLMAAAGLRVNLPNFKIDQPKLHEINQLKQKLNQERTEYISAITVLAQGCLTHLYNHDFREALRWANNEVLFHVQPKSSALKIALEKQNKALIQRIGVNFFQEGVPVITGALREGGIVAGVSAGAEELLKSLFKAYSECLERKKMPLANYGVMLAQALRE